MSYKKRYIIIAAVVTIILISASVIVWLIMQNNSAQDQSTSTQKVTVANVCSDDLIREANEPLASQDQVALGAVIDKIISIDGYDRDPNCLYITLQYSIAAGDAAASSNYFAKLERVFNSAVGYSNAFTVALTPLATLRQNVAFLKQSTAQDATNSDQENESTASGSEEADKYHKEHP